MDMQNHLLAMNIRLDNTSKHLQNCVDVYVSQNRSLPTCAQTSHVSGTRRVLPASTKDLLWSDLVGDELRNSTLLCCASTCPQPLLMLCDRCVLG